MTSKKSKAFNATLKLTAQTKDHFNPTAVPELDNLLESVATGFIELESQTVAAFIQAGSIHDNVMKHRSCSKS